MSLSRFTYDASAANFAQLVLGNPIKGWLWCTSGPRTLLRKYPLADDMESAMNELLEIVRQDRVFHDIGQRGLVSLFDLLCNGHPLTAHYRPLLADALH